MAVERFPWRPGGAVRSTSIMAGRIGRASPACKRHRAFEVETGRVPDPHSRSWRPGRRDCSRAALGCRVPRRFSRPGLPKLWLRAHRRAGRRVLPSRRQADSSSRARHAPGRIDHPGPYPAPPGRRVLGTRARRVVNTARSAADLGLDDFVRGRPAGTFCTVPATDLALANIGKPYPNAALLGGFAALSGRISIDSVCSAIRERFSGRVAEANVVAAVAAHAHVAGAQPEQTAAAGVGDAQAD
jgi:hypothetical protein